MPTTRISVTNNQLSCLPVSLPTSPSKTVPGHHAGGTKTGLPPDATELKTVGLADKQTVHGAANLSQALRQATALWRWWNRQQKGPAGLRALSLSTVLTKAPLRVHVRHQDHTRPGQKCLDSDNNNYSNNNKNYSNYKNNHSKYSYNNNSFSNNNNNDSNYNNNNNNSSNYHHYSNNNNNNNG
ncbi:hypothetical protein PoB_005972600 [Plakobranchus ocellatus]|uniref:Uncharacterized protein n=1 Tax=Plakobranchus ocellatus TaxID=259542 RepID=A0AAV4CD23_9GAST|nr:hypothetical protein PoB_005972600 [Plakobranchus ocellatus]